MHGCFKDLKTPIRFLVMLANFWCFIMVVFLTWDRRLGILANSYTPYLTKVLFVRLVNFNHNVCGNDKIFKHGSPLRNNHGQWVHILANIWKSEIRTFPSFWPSLRRRHELPLRKHFLGGCGSMLPQKVYEFSLSRMAENAPNLSTLIKSVHRFQQIDHTLRRCVYSHSWFRIRFTSIKQISSRFAEKRHGKYYFKNQNSYWLKFWKIRTSWFLEVLKVKNQDCPDKIRTVGKYGYIGW